MLMKSSAHSLFLCLALLSAGFTLHAAETTAPTTAPYLLAGAPSFDQSISQFREAFNQANPTLQLDEFRAIDGPRDTPILTRAASKINENLYASTALERGTLKSKACKSRLPIQGPEQKAAKAKALEYMSAVLQAFTPALTKSKASKAAKTPHRR